MPRHDIATCSYCGEREHIHLLDGVLDENDQDTGKLSCIGCYPNNDSHTYAMLSPKHIELSINPRLRPLYEQWIKDHS